MLERIEERVYFRDDGGEWHRVYDVRYHEQRKHVMPLESSQANTRYFIGQGGEVRAYSFTKLTRAP